MTKTVHCSKLKQDLPALSAPPYPGELGQRIYKNISKTAWDQWVGQQTMLINENRLNTLEPQTRVFIEQAMVKFLFEGENTTPEGYIPTN